MRDEHIIDLMGSFSFFFFLKEPKGSEAGIVGASMEELCNILL